MTTTTEALRSALRKAYHLGQIYWQQADSEFTSQHRKADETAAKLEHLIADTVAAFEAAQPAPAAPQEPVAWLLRPKVQRHPDRPMIRGVYWGPRTQQDFEFAELDGDEYVPLYMHPAQPAAEPDERAAFEADAEALGFDIRRDPRGSLSGEPWCDYTNIETGHRWAGWLAAATRAQPAPAAHQPQRRYSCTTGGMEPDVNGEWVSVCDAAPAPQELGDRFMEILRAIHGEVPDAFADSARLAFVQATKDRAQPAPAAPELSEEAAEQAYLHAIGVKP